MLTTTRTETSRMMPHSLQLLSRPVCLIALLLLAGCASQTNKVTKQSPGEQSPQQDNMKPATKQDSARPSKPPVAPQLSDWEKYQQVLRGIENWQVQGKLGIRLPGDSGSLYFNWLQHPEAFAIHLSGPLGQGASWIRGGSPTNNTQQVSLERGQQPPVYADNLETLMHSTLGWSLPVSELYYWVRGIPAPNTPIELLTRDEEGRLANLQQQGWKLRFERYKMIESWSLPGKLIAEREPLKLTFIIKNWKLSK